MYRLPLLVALCAGVLAGCPARSGFELPDGNSVELTGDPGDDGGSDPGNVGDVGDTTDSQPTDQEVFIQPRFRMQYDRSWVVLERANAMVALVPEASLPATYTVSPALPDGLLLDSTTGVISGTPTVAVAPFTTYEINGVSGVKTSKAVLRIAVVEVIKVDTIADLASTGTLGDGICAPAGECSIRAAVAEANALAGVQAIIVPSGDYTLSASLAVFNDVILGTRGGPGSTTITATGNLISLFTAGAAALPFMADLDVSRSSTSAGNGGCFSSAGKLSLTHLVIHDCSAVSGGAIDINGTGELALESSTLSDNVASVHGGAIVVRDSANITVLNSTFTDNLAPLGAAVAVNGAAATLSSSYFGDNISQSGGGGVYVFSGAQVAVVNATFEGNSSTGSTGGAMLSFGRLDVAYSTFSGNLANRAGSVISVQGGVTNMRGTLMFGQAAPCDTTDLNFVSQGYNVLDVAKSTCPELTAATDKAGAGVGTFDGSAAANGGPTLTIRIDANGAAYDVGDYECPSFDQRGEPRPQSASATPTCDAGSFEIGLETS